MKQTRFGLAVVLVAALLGVGLTPGVQPAVAQSSGTTITSAVFSVYQQFNPNPSATVRVHRITAPWVEADVNWASFGGAFDPATIATFEADGTGWHTATVTSLVQAWVDNPSENYGLLLEQGATPYSQYTASEDDTAANRPRLDICYTRGGPETCFTIQRGVGQSQVADTYVWAGVTDYAGGDSPIVYTGLFTNQNGSGEKYSLFRFELRTPTAVQLQSLSARSSVPPELALAAVGVVSAAGLVMLRRRRIV
jgi:hypothetical protein